MVTPLADQRQLDVGFGVKGVEVHEVDRTLLGLRCPEAVACSFSFVASHGQLVPHEKPYSNGTSRGPPIAGIRPQNLSPV